jgi:hypothetical protein
MSPSNRKIVRIVQAPEKKVLSKAQKQFNNLIKNIDAQKKLLLAWQETIPHYHQKLNNEYDALWDAYNAQRVELLHLLDRAYDNTLFKKTDKAKIKRIVADLTFELISEHGKEELKELHNKYSDSDFDADKQEADAVAGDFMKSMLQDVFGMDIGDDVDISSPEKMQAVMQEKLQEIEVREAEHRRREEERRGKRKKTAKQLEKEAKQQQEKQNVSKSIQEVFRKLAAALHPDREPDPQERERKTEIMQRVNAAYTKKDLLQLLELQLEAEQIDQEHLNNIAEDRLKYFNKILQEQLEELREEIARIEMPFKMQLQLSPYAPLSPQHLMQVLEHDIRTVRHDIAGVKRDIQTFQNLASLKAWLKGYKISKKAPVDDLDDLFLGGFGPPFGFK